MPRSAFRFATSVNRPLEAGPLGELARRSEEEGFDALYVADHLGMPSPFSPLAVVAAATETLRVGNLVVNHDFWNPVVLAREAATLAVLSDGRFELGIGAGHAEVEYRAAGISYDPAGLRVDRMTETIGVVRRLLDGESVSHDGTFHRLVEAAVGFDVPGRIPLLVGGNGDKVLATAARHADTVGLVGFTSGTGQTHSDLSHFRWSGLEERIAHVRQHAAERFDDLELNVLVQQVSLGDPQAAAETFAAASGQPVDLMLDSPFLMLGSVDVLVEHCERLRSLGVSSVAAFDGRGADQLAPVIARVH